MLLKGIGRCWQSPEKLLFTAFCPKPHKITVQLGSDSTMQICFVTAWIKISFTIYLPNKIQILKLFFIYRGNKVLSILLCSLKNGASKNIMNFCILKVGRYLAALLSKIINLNISEERKKERNELVIDLFD